MNRAAAEELLRQYGEWLGTAFYASFGEPLEVARDFLNETAAEC